MDSVYLKLYNYLRDVIYDPGAASLDIEQLPEDVQDFGSNLKHFAQGVIEANSIAVALAAGVLSNEMPDHGNEIAAPLKSLQSSLRHLVWQVQLVAQGDYDQRIAFMRDFTNAFNSITEQLANRAQRLEKQGIAILRKSLALDRANLLLTSLVHHLPQQIFIIDKATSDVLLRNEIASYELKKDENYLKKIMECIDEQDIYEAEGRINIKSNNPDELDRLLIIKKYEISWNDSEAEAYIVTDVTVTEENGGEMPLSEHCDNLTGLYTRFFGMLTIDRWIHEKKHFSVIFINLESMKFVNEVFGKKEGDIYLINAAGHLREIAAGAVVCRLGGDEFMILTPGLTIEEAHEKMGEVNEKLSNDAYQIGKQLHYNFSYGIAEVSEKNTLPICDILRIAEERMYEKKKQNWINQTLD